MLERKITHIKETLNGAGNNTVGRTVKEGMFEEETQNRDIKVVRR